MNTNNILKDKSIELPNDRSLNNPKSSKIVRVARQLSEGLSNVNKGGCGIFASMLDSIFNGEIVQLRFISKEFLYEMGQYDNDWHEVLIKDGICYDAYFACTKANLLRMKNIKSIITMEKLDYQIKPNKFFLIKRNSQCIIDDYRKGQYNQFFANRRKMQILFHNYEKVLSSPPKGTGSGINHSKVKTILDSYNSIMAKLAA